MFPEQLPNRTLKIIGLEKKNDEEESKGQTSSDSKQTGPKKRGNKKIDFNKNIIDIKRELEGEAVPIYVKMAQIEE